MILWLTVLVLFALLMVFAEILLPGFGLFGIVAAIIVLAVSIVTAALYGKESAMIFLGFFLVTIIIMRIVVKRSKLFSGDKFHEANEEIEPEQRNELLGRIGVSRTAIRQSGVAMFSGMPVEVVSMDKYIDKGKSVVVIQVTRNEVIVKEC